MLAQPIVDAIEANPVKGRRIYLSPRGRTLTQGIVEELAKDEELLLLCGHYEGVDQRALDIAIDEELSIGDYVLTGGELGALVVIDAVSRLIPGVLGRAESSVDESFSSGLLEYPQYTRPREYRKMAVPDVLCERQPRRDQPLAQERVAQADARAKAGTDRAHGPRQARPRVSRQPLVIFYRNSACTPIPAVVI